MHCCVLFINQHWKNPESFLEHLMRDPEVVEGLAEANTEAVVLPVCGNMVGTALE